MPTDTELRERLAATVAAVEPPPDIVERARLGGRRRLRRHRTITTAAVLATTAVAGFLVIGTNPLADPTPDPARPPDRHRAVQDPYGWLMAQPPRGDLVQDKEYVREVKTAWQRSHANSPLKARGIFDDLRGEPKVAWAGQTPAGKGAVVVQDAYLHPKDVDPAFHGLCTVIGFIGEGSDGRARLLESDHPGGERRLPGFFLGRTLVVLDDGQPIGYATQREYGADGSISRNWAPLAFRNGAAIVALPAGTNLAAVRLKRLDRPELLGIAGQPLPRNMQIHWLGSFAAGGPLTPGAVPDRGTYQWLDEAVSRNDPTNPSFNGGHWQVYGTTPNGSQVVATEFCYDDDPSHVYAAVKSRDGRIRLVHGGVPDWSAAMPVAIRLPDGQGWVTASFGARLQYRLADGSWNAPGDNALLVPDGPGVDEVRVTRRGVPRLVGLE